jgi:membrane protein DedA with SNARE-associated domain
MPHHVLEFLRGYLAQYGYWAIAAALLLENVGLPVPGETILLGASFLAFSEHRLRLPYIILVGICAATLGDNIGFAIGHYGGRPLLERYQKALHIPRSAISRGEYLFDRYGAVTIAVARFIAGLRVIAGPLAGVLRMHWRKFVVFNFVGAALWVTVISSAGYLSGKHWERLMHIVRDANIAVLAAAVVLGLLLWLKRRSSSLRPS